MNQQPPSEARPGIGNVLAARYRLVQRVGRGAMAEVFRARDEFLHRDVAVKVFRFDPGSEVDRRRIDAEMRTLANLRHAGLVTLFDAGPGDPDSGQAPYLVMELITGPTLRDHLSAGPLPPDEVARLGAELATALRYVHGVGLIHRDVKPANVLLEAASGEDSALTAKLSDFGIARITDGTSITATGMTLGTANYLSPEQARGMPLGPPSDVYALGLVLLECLTGAVVYPGAGVEAALARLTRPVAIPADLPPGWSALLTSMTTFDAASRPDAARVAVTLRSIAGGAVPLRSSSLEDTVPLALPPTRRRGRGWVWAWATGAAAAVAVVAGVLIAVIGGTGGSAVPNRHDPGTQRPAGSPTTAAAGSTTDTRTSSASTAPARRTSTSTNPTGSGNGPGKGTGIGTGKGQDNGRGRGKGKGGNGKGSGKGKGGNGKGKGKGSGKGKGGNGQGKGREG